MPHAHETEYASTLIHIVSEICQPRSISTTQTVGWPAQKT